MAMNSLSDVLVDLLKDTYHAEKQLVAALPKMAKAASSEDLRAAFQDHLEETKGHVERLQEAFAVLEMKPVGKICHGMKGLVEEGKEVIEQKKEGNPAAVDAALIAAAQKVEHYEITAYGTLVTFATTLGHSELADIFQQVLEEEKAADETLNGLAEGSINAEAADADESEDEDEEESAAAGRSKKTAKRSR